MYSFALWTPVESEYGIVGMPLRVSWGVDGHALPPVRFQTSTRPSDASEKRMCTTMSIQVSLGYGIRPGIGIADSQ